MARIVLTADATQMSEYWGIPLLPFFSCAPAEKVPRIVFDFLSPQVKHNNGVAQMAPYGLRKLEASILRTYKPEEVVVAHPDHVSKFVNVPRGPKLEQIPDIVGASTHGLVEVMRGCGRNCQFCEPNLRTAKYYPADKIEREIAVNRKIGNPNVWIHSEDIFLYKLEDKNGFMPNHEAVVDLFKTVMTQGGITYANPTHGTTAPAAADPELIKQISDTVRAKDDKYIGIQSGLETGSSELIRKYMPLKVKPFSPSEWQEVIYNGTRFFNENYWFPAYTLIVGLPGETTDDAIETVRLIDKMEHGLRKEIGNRAHFTVTPLSFVPLGVLKNKGFFNIDEAIDEARFWVIYRSWRHTVLELHSMPPTLMKLNPAFKAIFTTLCWFGSKKILDSIKAWGRSLGYDADKSLRLN